MTRVTLTLDFKHYKAAEEAFDQLRLLLDGGDFNPLRVQDAVSDNDAQLITMFEVK